jgi:hypothetical protein
MRCQGAVTPIAAPAFSSTAQIDDKREQASPHFSPGGIENR